MYVAQIYVLIWLNENGRIKNEFSFASNLRYTYILLSFFLLLLVMRRKVWRRPSLIWGMLPRTAPGQISPPAPSGTWHAAFSIFPHTFFWDISLCFQWKFQLDFVFMGLYKLPKRFKQWFVVKCFYLVLEYFCILVGFFLSNLFSCLLCFVYMLESGVVVDMR